MSFAMRIGRWSRARLVVVWLTGCLLELAMLRLRHAGSPGWAWGADPTQSAGDPLAGYSRFWRYHEELRLLGGIGVWVVPLVVLAVTWLWFNSSEDRFEQARR